MQMFIQPTHQSVLLFQTKKSELDTYDVEVFHNLQTHSKMHLDRQRNEEEKIHKETYILLVWRFYFQATVHTTEGFI